MSLEPRGRVALDPRVEPEDDEWWGGIVHYAEIVTLALDARAQSQTL